MSPTSKRRWARHHAPGAAPSGSQDWVLVERERLRELFIGTVHQLATLLGEAREFGRAIAITRRAIVADPVHEGPHRDLMHLYRGAGEPHAALRQYAELEGVLRRELGTSPSAATQKLAEDLGRRAAARPTVAVEPIPAPPPSEPPAHARPAGTVTFLMVGSVVEAVRSILTGRGGYLAAETSDALVATFARPSDALACATACHQTLERHADNAPMTLDTGEVEIVGHGYQGRVLDRAWRLLSAAHPGQVLCSEETAVLLRRNLGPDVQLVDLGPYRLRGSTVPERLFEVRFAGHEGRAFPPPKADRGRAGNLPLRLTRFFGRSEELAGIEALMLGEQTRRRREDPPRAGGGGAAAGANGGCGVVRAARRPLGGEPDSGGGPRRDARGAFPRPHAPGSSRGRPLPRAEPAGAGQLRALGGGRLPAAWNLVGTSALVVLPRDLAAEARRGR
ncbi:MAG: hypothetical protein JRI25_19055 [Deltaproteobacteria bacterium]|nr:hypothetical protein [Deltaproteobacteria bacterium]